MEYKKKAVVGMQNDMNWRRVVLVVVMLITAFVLRPSPPLQAGQVVANDASTREVIIGMTQSQAERVQRTAVGDRKSVV